MDSDECTSEDSKRKMEQGNQEDIFGRNKKVNRMPQKGSKGAALKRGVH